MQTDTASRCLAEDSIVAPLFPAVGAPRQGLTRFPSNFLRSERCCGLHPASVFNVDELVTQPPSFPL